MKQAEEGLSLDAQVERIKAYAKAHGGRVVAVERDPAKSGDRLDRPGLQAALERLQAGQGQTLVVAKLDRLTRNVYDLGLLLREYFGATAPYQFAAVADSVDTSTAAGRMTMNVLMSVAQWERETVAERTVAVRESKLRRGEHVGGEPPYGYRVVDRDGVSMLEPDPTEREAMKMAKGLRRRLDCSLQDIADAFNEEAVPRRNGRDWTRQAISRLLE